MGTNMPDPMHMHTFHRIAGSILLLIVIGLVPLRPADAANISMISIDQLKLILDNPQVLVIDVRATKAWRDSPVKIKGAVRGAPNHFDSWSSNFPRDKALILY